MERTSTVRRFAHPIASLVIVALSTSCAHTPDATQPPGTGFGESKGTAIEVCHPEGERAYLARLVCGTGESASFDRVGNFGPRNELPPGKSLSDLIGSAHRDPLAPGEIDYHVVDGYELTCGQSRQLIYFDMYHCHQAAPDQAPPGYTLKQAAPSPQ